MRELDGLREHYRRLPPNDGLDQVIRQGRRRRMRAIAVMAAGGGGLSLALALAIGPGLGSASLRTVNPAGGGHASNGGAAASAGAVAHAGTVASNQGTTNGGARSGGPTTSGTSATTAPAESPGRPTSEPMHRSHTQEAFTTCGNNVGVGPGGVSRSGGDLCGSTSAVANGRQVKLDVQLCLTSTVNAAEALHFPSDLETDFSLTSQATGRTVWRWSAGRTFRADAHVISVQPGECFDWDTVWNEVDNHGHAVPSGTYVVTGTSSAREFGSHNSWTDTVDLGGG